MPSRSVTLLLLAIVAVLAGGWLLASRSGTPASGTGDAEERAPVAVPREATLPERAEVPAAPKPAPSPPRTVGPGGAVAGSGFHGQVREVGGGPVPDIRLELVDREGTVVFSTVSDASGRFSFGAEPPAPGLALWTQDVAGTGPRLKHRIDPARAAGVRAVWILPPGVIEGVVVDEAGRAVEGASVTTDRVVAPFGMSWNVAEGEELTIYEPCVSDANGRFRLRFALRGRHRLRAELEGRQASGDFEAGERNAVLALGMHPGATLTISGRVVDAATDRPVPGVKVFADRVRSIPGGSSAKTSGAAVSDDAGRYEIAGLEAGRYYLTARPKGYAIVKTPTEERAPGLHTVDLTIHPARALRVRVLQRNGEPFPRVSIRADDRDGRTVEMMSTMRIPTRAERTGADGAARLRGLPATSLTLVATAGDLLPCARADVDLRNPIDDVVTIQMPCELLSRSRTHYFLLRDASGGPAEITGTAVAESYDGGLLVSHVEGRWRGKQFVFGHSGDSAFDEPTIAVSAPRGPCAVKISVPGYREVSLTLERDASSPTRVTLQR